MPTTFEFTTTPAPALYVEGKRFRRKIIFTLQTRYAISCVVNFYNVGVVIRDRKIAPGADPVMNNTSAVKTYSVGKEPM
jgi:hypothetical protein